MDCLYCNLNSGPEESEHFIRFMETPGLMLYLHRDQSLPGRFVVATRDHFNDITDVPDDIYSEFCNLTHRYCRAVRLVFPDTVKINWALCGNASEAHHTHLHVLPRHIGDRHWPDFFLDYVHDYWPAGDKRYKEIIKNLRSECLTF
jgi:diadenosine tetraphosphate (Ap4A) HIT family hydrolase